MQKIPRGSRTDTNVSLCIKIISEIRVAGDVERKIRRGADAEANEVV